MGLLAIQLALYIPRQLLTSASKRMMILERLERSSFDSKRSANEHYVSNSFEASLVDHFHTKFTLAINVQQFRARQCILS